MPTTAIEKSWPAVAPQLFTADGTVHGVITVADSRGFKVKQQVALVATGQPNINVKIMRFISPTQFYVGPVNPKAGQGLTGRQDISAYTVANGAYIYAEEQPKVTIKPEDIIQAVYRQEPGTTIGVEIDDQFGNPIDSVIGADGRNRLAVDAAVTVTGVTVDIDALTPPTKPDPDNVLIVGSEDGTKGGLKHAARVDSMLDLRVGISYGANKAIVDATGRVSVIDGDAVAALGSILTSLTSIRNALPTSLGPQPMAGSLSVTIASNQTPIPVTATITGSRIISGTDNGQPGGTEFVFVNNVRSQILAAKDRDQVFTYADFGTKNQRITLITYTAPSIGTGAGFTALKTLNYTLVGNRYRRDNIIWSLV